MAKAAFVSIGMPGPSAALYALPLVAIGACGATGPPIALCSPRTGGFPPGTSPGRPCAGPEAACPGGGGGGGGGCRPAGGPDAA
eukprot:scaffold576_cov260-Pinguiococcus_pyrenoidosus.AAC.6